MKQNVSKILTADLRVVWEDSDGPRFVPDRCRRGLHILKLLRAYTALAIVIKSVVGSTHATVRAIVAIEAVAQPRGIIAPTLGTTDRLITHVLQAPERAPRIDDIGTRLCLVVPERANIPAGGRRAVISLAHPVYYIARLAAATNAIQGGIAGVSGDAEGLARAPTRSAGVDGRVTRLPLGIKL